MAFYDGWASSDLLEVGKTLVVAGVAIGEYAGQPTYSVYANMACVMSWNKHWFALLASLDGGGVMGPLRWVGSDVTWHRATARNAEIQCRGKCVSCRSETCLAQVWKPSKCNIRPGKALARG